MIDARELRTGNLLNYDTSEGETLPTKIDWQYLKWLDEDTKVFNLVHTPIPLTEEILLKCGFEKNECVSNFNDTFSIVSKSNSRRAVGLHQPKQFENTSIYFVMFREDVGIDFSDLNEIEYLHELQNLYFALTGDELDIQL